MAKDYYSIKTQRIEFDTDRLTMTVTMHDEKFTVISVQTLNEAEFSSLYYRFKADYFSSKVVEENAQSGSIGLTSQEGQRVQDGPTLTTFDDFVEMKDRALTILNSMIFASGSAQ